MQKMVKKLNDSQVNSEENNGEELWQKGKESFLAFTKRHLDTVTTRFTKRTIEIEGRKQVDDWLKVSPQFRMDYIKGNLDEAIQEALESLSEEREAVGVPQPVGKNRRRRIGIDPIGDLGIPPEAKFTFGIGEHITETTFVPEESPQEDNLVEEEGITVASASLSRIKDLGTRHIVNANDNDLCIGPPYMKTRMVNANGNTIIAGGPYGKLIMSNANRNFIYNFGPPSDIQVAGFANNNRIKQMTYSGPDIWLPISNGGKGTLKIINKNNTTIRLGRPYESVMMVNCNKNTIIAGGPFGKLRMVNCNDNRIKNYGYPFEIDLVNGNDNKVVQCTCPVEPPKPRPKPPPPCPVPPKPKPKPDPKPKPKPVDPPIEPPPPRPIESPPEPPPPKKISWDSKVGYFVALADITWYEEVPRTIESPYVDINFDSMPEQFLRLAEGDVWQSEWFDSGVIRGLNIDVTGKHKLSYSKNGDFET